MAKKLTEQIVINLDAALLAQLDERVKKDAARTGFNVSRASVVRSILGKALDR